MGGGQQAPGPCVVACARGFQREPEAQISQVGFTGFSPVSLCAPRPSLRKLPAPWGRLALGSWRNKQVPCVGCLEVGQLVSGSSRQAREGGTLDAAPAARASPFYPTSCRVGSLPPPEALFPKTPRDCELHFSHANLCSPLPSGTLTLLSCSLLHFWMTRTDVGVEPKSASTGF